MIFSVWRFSSESNFLSRVCREGVGEATWKGSLINGSFSIWSCWILLGKVCRIFCRWFRDFQLWWSVDISWRSKTYQNFNSSLEMFTRNKNCEALITMWLLGKHLKHYFCSLDLNKIYFLVSFESGKKVDGRSFFPRKVDEPLERRGK